MTENASTPTPTPADPANLTVDLYKETDVGYWCEIFGIEPSQLRAAVQATGPRAVDVARYLRHKHQGGDRA
ncbi:MAG: DUF3606 domain-containing protein [Microbacteriaceae bacterium]|nr:DUF3606 domain-containing protein [Burkholderiaceae bacterium]